MMPPMREHSYFTYIMASRSHTLYVGVTSDLHNRVLSINGRSTTALRLSTTATDSFGLKNTRRLRAPSPARRS